MDEWDLLYEIGESGTIDDFLKWTKRNTSAMVNSNYVAKSVVLEAAIEVMERVSTGLSP